MNIIAQILKVAISEILDISEKETFYGIIRRTWRKYDNSEL
jgi:hypothetical protein